MKKTIRRILSLTLCMLLAVSAFSVNIASGAQTLTLDENAVFIDGYNEGGKFVFKPENTMKRSEAIKIVAVIAGWNAEFDASSVKTAFTDLGDDEWYASYVKYLEKYDMLDFFGKTLSADKGITRGEFVELISDFVPEKPGTKTFPDVSVSHPYCYSIIKAARAGIVEGNPDGTFNPNGTLKRAEIVTIINRLIGRNIIDSNTVKVNKFSDIVGHWSEKYVIAASCSATYQGKILWYTGELYAANSPVDKTTLDYSTTQEILDGVDASIGSEVKESLEEYTEKRIAEIRNTPTTVTPGAGGTAYYVSADGSDYNNGKSPETAWKTLDKVSNMRNYFKSGDVIYFRRGDEFRGKLKTADNVTYSAYGEGAKPIINGSLKNYAGGTFWKATDKKNVWEASETFRDDVGNIVFDESQAGIKKVKGINGTALLFDLEFYYDPATGKLTLYSAKDPNTRFKSIEICTAGSIIEAPGTSSVCHNLTIDNICIMYGGGYGIRYSHGSTNFVASNCEIGWCGGAVQSYNASDIVRLGNGIELFSTIDGFIVDNCYIYQIYDAGVSHQYFGTIGNDKTIVRNMWNVKYTNNVITHCTYALEYINGHQDGIMENIEVSGNLFLATGSGFGNQRPERNGSLTAGIKAWGGPNNSRNFLIYDNVIEATDREAALIHMCVDDKVNMPEVTGNLFVGKTGNRFGLYGEGDFERDKDMITCNESVTEKTIGLDDNTFVFTK